MPDPVVRQAAAGDSESLAAIYNHYVESTTVTFEEQAVQAARPPWYVAAEDGKPVGYAYAAPWKARPAYRWSAEVTVYLAPDCGDRRYRLAKRAEREAARKMWIPESGALCRSRLQFGRWIDVGYWETLL